MGDDLSIGGSGSVAVASDELFANAEQLRELAQELLALHHDLASIMELNSVSLSPLTGAPRDIAGAENDLEQARFLLTETESQARAIYFALEAAARGYGFAENVVGHLIHQSAGQFSGLLARFSPLSFVAAVAAVATAGAAGGILLRAGSSGGRGRHSSGAGHSATPWKRLSNEIITNPITTGLIRTSTQASGAVVAGSFGIPPALSELLGLDGPALSSTVVMGAGSLFGVLKETPVKLVDSHTQVVTASPSGYADRLSRVPDTSETDRAQVVIEKYSTPGEPDRFEVYVAGTVTFSPVADKEPWDMTSNMANAVGGGSGSYDSVAAAMERAGIDESSPVQFTGYSQGAGTVAQLAASGDYNTQGLAAFGGPTGQVPIPEGFPTVIVEHTDDLVPALGGEQANNHAVLVERDVFAGREVPADKPVPSHHYEYYRETAQLMDQAQSAQVTEAIKRLDGFAQGSSTITSTAYQFERVAER
ncbi:MAG: hypothetical protein ACRCSP_02420 [Rhodoglobus sp.]